MDFARNQLKKYGWVEGKGLGKEEAGMVDALKPKSKRSLGGLGHDMADEFTNQWWHRVYNNATSNIKINSSEDGEVKSFNTSENLKDNKTKLNKMPLYFQTFIQSAVLENGQTTHQKDSHIDDKKPLEICDSNMNEKSESESKIKHLTDDELFAACGKRTAHKGARHGLKLNGKLARLEMQEKELMSKIKLKSKHKVKDNSEKKISTNESLKNNDVNNKSIIKRKKHKTIGK